MVTLAVLLSSPFPFTFSKILFLLLAFPQNLNKEKKKIEVEMEMEMDTKNCTGIFISKITFYLNGLLALPFRMVDPIH